MAMSSGQLHMHTPQKWSIPTLYPVAISNEEWICHWPTFFFKVTLSSRCFNIITNTNTPAAAILTKHKQLLQVQSQIAQHTETHTGQRSIMSLAKKLTSSKESNNAFIAVGLA